MQTYRLTLEPLTAFGTPLAGDTLFGQLCWTLRHQLGNDKLETLLDGYTQNAPFAILSDAFPENYVPLPTFPVSFWEEENDTDRKQLKARHWLHIDQFASSEPVAQWRKKACNDRDVLKNSDNKDNLPCISHEMQPHNTINRATGTTGTGMFAPYTQSRIWYAPKMRLHCYVLLDEQRLSPDALFDALKTIGLTGYGRDASSGLGKYDIKNWTTFKLPANKGKTCLTLAPCAPQGMHYQPEKSFYQIQTRFGRHGDMAARGEIPFKRPLLMAKTGAVFTLGQTSQQSWIGQGIAQISHMDSKTVHQGYAPIIYLPDMESKVTA